LLSPVLWPGASAFLLDLIQRLNGNQPLLTVVNADAAHWG
jgi:hypothetical protein